MNDTNNRDDLSRNVRKRTFDCVQPAKIQISLRIRAVWSESSLCAFWITTEATVPHTYNEDSDQTARMCRLIWVFVRRTCQTVRFLALRFIYLLMVPVNWISTQTPFDHKKHVHVQFQL